MEPEERPLQPQLPLTSSFRVSSSSARGRPSSSDLVEQSPLACSHAAHSDCPSDAFSWHDDASSSLATFSSTGGTIIVNTQRMRMGEHLKGKLEGMIRQRFENYLRIVNVLQNETGKLTALVCELGAPFRDSATGLPARISISCNEDGTFLVYAAPEAAAADLHTTDVNPSDMTSSEDVGDPPQLRAWVEHVCEYGMSGRCQSLTALFHFGYTIWSSCKRQDGPCGPIAGIPGGGEMPAKIAEEEERPRDDIPENSRILEPQVIAPLSSSAPIAVSSCLQPSSGSTASKDGRSSSVLLMAAEKAADAAQYQQALDLCDEVSDMVSRGLSLSSSASSFDRGVTSANPENYPDAEVAYTMQQVLLLRARIQVGLRRFDLALQDAERLIQSQPTCADGYYWQAIALQGMDHGQEALEALMSALEYDPQNSMFQTTFTALFEEISASAPPATVAAAQPRVLQGQGRRNRGGQLGDALSMTTQATHLSSRSTTPTEVSAPQSRSSSHDSLYGGETPGAL